MVVRRRRDSAGSLVCPVGRETQVERTVCAHVARNRRYAMGDSRSPGVHVLWIGYEPYRFVYARPGRVGYGEQFDWHEHHRRLFPDPSWSRHLCGGWWNAVYAALRLVRVSTAWVIIPSHTLQHQHAHNRPVCHHLDIHIHRLRDFGIHWLDQ